MVSEKNKSQLRRPAGCWLPLGLFLVALSLMLPHLFRPGAWLSTGGFDGLRGLVAGIGIGIEISFVIRVVRFRRAVA